MSELTTHIQGHGEHRAVRAVELQPGDVIVWNGPTTVRVYSIAPVPSKSGLFLTLTTVTRNGEVYQRRKRRDCAIAFVRIGPVPILSGELPDQQHLLGTHKLAVREVCQNCQTPFPEKLHRTVSTPIGFCCGACAATGIAHQGADEGRMAALNAADLTAIEEETTAAVEADRKAREAYREKHATCCGNCGASHPQPYHAQDGTPTGEGVCERCGSCRIVPIAEYRRKRLLDLKLFLLDHQTHAGMGPSLLTAFTRSRLHQKEDVSKAINGGRDDLDKLADALLNYIEERKR